LKMDMHWQGRASRPEAWRALLRAWGKTGAQIPP
jgi:hypothetical protein